MIPYVSPCEVSRLADADRLADDILAVFEIT